MKIIDAVAEFLAYKKTQAKLSAGSLISYQSRLKQFTEQNPGVTIEEIDAGLLRRYCAYLCAAPNADRNQDEDGQETGKRPRTISGHWTVLKGFILWLHRTERIAVNPIPYMELPAFDPADRHIIFAPEVRLILETIERIENPLQRALNRALAQVMASTGVRAAEACAIETSDIRFEENHLIVQHGKGNKRREVPLTDACKAALREWIDIRKSVFSDADSNFLFIHGSHRANFQTQGLAQRLCSLARLSGIADFDRFTCHAWRRFAAVEFYKATKDIRAVQMLLGHSNVQTTERYINLSSEHLIELRGSLSFGDAAPTPKAHPAARPAAKSGRSILGHIRLRAAAPETGEAEPGSPPAETPAQAPADAPPDLMAMIAKLTAELAELKAAQNAPPSLPPTRFKRKDLRRVRS